MSCVALAMEPRAASAMMAGAVLADMPSSAAHARHNSTSACIGKIQLRRRPKVADQRLSTWDAQRNFSTQGRPTSGRKARLSSDAPWRRSSAGRASIARPSGMPWLK